MLYEYSLGPVVPSDIPGYIPVTLTSEIIHISPSMLLDPENVIDAIMYTSLDIR